MLKPFYMLEGIITKIKELKVDTLLEITYEDENGDRAICIYKL